MSYKGKYTPINPKKYVGDSTNIIYRSLWERRFMAYCDGNPSVLSWASEELYIPYLSPVDNKIHRYFPDFLIRIKKSDGTVKTILIEIKPKSQCSPPKPQRRKTKNYLNEMKTWAVNEAKWKAAKAWCDDRKIEFKLITEKELGI